MAKRAAGAVPYPRTVQDAMAALEIAVGRQTKEKLAAALLDLARNDQSVRRKLELRFAVKVPPIGLVAATREAILEATLVVAAVQKARLPAEQVLTWCDAMVKESRGGLLNTAEIESLRKLVMRRKLSSP